MGRRVKGTGSIRDNDDGTKTMIRALTDPISGKQKKIQVTAKTEAACIKQMNRKIKDWEMKKSAFGDASSLTVTEVCESYLNYQVSQKLIKLTSRDRNEVTIKNQIDKYKIGRLQVGTVTSRDIDEHFANMISNSGLSKSTIEKSLFIIDATFNWLVSRDQLPRNPVNGVRNRIKKNLSMMDVSDENTEDVIVLSEKDEKLFVEESNKKDANGKYLYTGALHGQFLLRTGMRVGEYICLRWSDYNPELHILTINKTRHQIKNKDENVSTNYVANEGKTKNKKARNIVLNDEAVKILDEIRANSKWTEPDDYICLNSKGNNYTDTSMEHVVQNIYRKAGLRSEISGLHVLRRTFATRQFKAGFGLKEIAAYLGDEERTVARYYVAARDLQEINGKMVPVVTLSKNIN